MTKNPLVNALAAAAYITLVGTLMFYGSKMIGPVHSVIVPIAFISLFTLSASMMGYLFLLKPVTLYIDGQKREAVRLFVQTVAFFAVVTLIIFSVLFFISWRV